jgi:hypothetical protein
MFMIDLLFECDLYNVIAGSSYLNSLAFLRHKRNLQALKMRNLVCGNSEVFRTSPINFLLCVREDFRDAELSLFGKMLRIFLEDFRL